MTLEEMRQRKRDFGYTNEILAERSGVPLGTVQKIMAGVTKSPRKKTLDALRAAFAHGTEALGKEESVISVDAQSAEPTNGESGVMYPHIHPEKPWAFVRETAPSYGIEDREYTIEDIEALPDGILAELMDGKICYMECPTTTHQEIVAEMFLSVAGFIRAHNGPCKAFLSPFAVYLRDDKDYLVPDLTVICDRDKIDEKGCHGAPDWIVEVISPSTKKRDTGKKLFIYRDAGVREYWIIDPARRTITVHILEQGEEDTTWYRFEDEVSSYIFPGLKIRLADTI